MRMDHHGTRPCQMSESGCQVIDGDGHVSDTVTLTRVKEGYRVTPPCSRHNYVSLSAIARSSILTDFWDNGDEQCLVLLAPCAFDAWLQFLASTNTNCDRVTHQASLLGPGESADLFDALRVRQRQRHLSLPLS